MSTPEGSYYERHRAQRIAATRAWQVTNAAHRRDYMRKYYKRRKAQLLAYKKWWRDQQREHLRLYERRRQGTAKRLANWRKWARRNKHKRLIAYHRRRAAKFGGAGRHTHDEWIALCRKFKWRCVRCGRRRKLTKDHVIPLSLRGTDDIANIQPLCKSCNCSKQTSCEDYRRDVA